MKKLEFNEDFLLEFSVYGNNRSAYNERLMRAGLEFDRQKIDDNTDRFVIESTINARFIAQLNNFLNPQ